MKVFLSKSVKKESALTLLIKIFFITGLVALGAVVFGLPANHDTDLASNDNSTMLSTLDEAKSIISDIVKREEGPSAVVPDVPAALIRTLGNNDCYLDCKEDFPKAFVCWYYNNTRCDGCLLTSDDDSCRDLCVCRKIGQNGSDKTIAGAQPVALPDVIVKEKATDPEPGTESKRGANKIYCGSTDLTQSCKMQSTTCSDEGIVSDNTTCLEHCYCRNWDSTSLIESEAVKRDSDSISKIYPLNCGSQNLTEECAASGTWCTTEGLTSDSDICREQCKCQPRSITAVATNDVLSTKNQASNSSYGPSVRCIGLDLTAACLTNGTTCTTDGIETSSKKCSEHCWCQDDVPTKVEARYATSTQEQVVAGPWSCGLKRLDEECALQNTFCTGHGLDSDSDICRDQCFCHRLTSKATVDQDLNFARGSIWCGSIPMTQHCRDEKTFCTDNGLAGNDATCLQECDCIKHL